MIKESRVNKGRIGVYAPDHPGANNRGYIPRSRYTMEQHLGRYLRSDEEVHHKDGDKLNDQLENLEILTKAEHARRHQRAKSPLDYNLLSQLRENGLGYKKIAKETGYALSSVKAACKLINLGAMGVD